MTSLLLAILVLVWVQLSRTPWRNLGFVQPASWAVTVAAGVALGVELKIVLKAAAMPREIQSRWQAWRLRLLSAQDSAKNLSTADSCSSALENCSDTVCTRRCLSW